MKVDDEPELTEVDDDGGFSHMTHFHWLKGLLFLSDKNKMINKLYIIQEFNIFSN